MEIFNEIDNDRQEGKQECNAVYEKLKGIYASDMEMRGNIELLWRLARVCNDVAATIIEPKDPKKREILKEGQKYALEAYGINDGDFNVLKWIAALTGQLTDFLGTKERIEQGSFF